MKKPNQTDGRNAAGTLRETSISGPPEASPRIREFIAARPGRIVRRGTAFICGIMAAVLSGMCFIGFPDRLEGEAILSTDPGPVRIKVSSGGRLIRLFVAENEQLVAGQPIAELENNTGYEHIRALMKLILEIRNNLDSGDDSALTAACTGISQETFGNAQELCNGLYDAVATYVLIRSKHIYAHRGELLKSQDADIRSLAVIGSTEETLIREELSQAEERYRANEALYRDKVISRQEYFAEAAQLRSGQLALQRQRRAAIQQAIAISRSGMELIEAGFEQADQSRRQLAEIHTRLRQLRSFIHDWQQKYLISSPMDGRIHFPVQQLPGQMTDPQEVFCAIVPVSTRYLASVKMPAQGMGKVLPGQEVQLMADRYPAAEFGYLKGRVRSISAMTKEEPGGSFYLLSVILPDTLLSSHGNTIPFTPEMSARAAIITRERNMLQRLFGGG